MTIIGTPLSSQARRLMVLGAGELGKEVLIEAQRLGIETIAVDHYANAPAMQVAHRAHVVDMLDASALTAIIRTEQPDIVIPEVEAIATAVLVDLEADGLHVVPTARATQLTMDREGIRRLAAETLALPTSPYRFVESVDELSSAVEALGLPCVVKPLMSSSGKGQSVLRNAADLEQAWKIACSGGRAGSRRAIVEGFVEFDFEITLLTVRHSAGTTFCAPIGHRQVDGDYRESWQPQAMSGDALQRAQAIATTITDALGGYGLFGVEFFVCGDEVIFSEVSPRPHDTGLVTLISQPLSQFALHVRAVLGLAQPDGIQCRPAASVPLLAQGHGVPRFEIPADALAGAGLDLRLFGKPSVAGARRVGVALATGSTIEDARRRANRLAESIQIRLEVFA